MAEPVGRPTIKIDWNRVDQLLECGCTSVEIAAAFGVHRDTLAARLLEEKGVNFSNYSAEKRSKGDGMLLQAQFKNAMTGNTSMLQFLGKVRLKQRETDDVRDVLPLLDPKVTIENQKMTIDHLTEKLKAYESTGSVCNKSEAESELRGSDPSL